jgi:hypothetical protein
MQNKYSGKSRKGQYIILHYLSHQLNVIAAHDSKHYDISQFNWLDSYGASSYNFLKVKSNTSPMLNESYQWRYFVKLCVQNYFAVRYL